MVTPKAQPIIPCEPLRNVLQLSDLTTFRSRASLGLGGPGHPPRAAPLGRVTPPGMQPHLPGPPFCPSVQRAFLTGCCED